MALIPYIFGEFVPTAEVLRSFAIPLGYWRSHLSNLDEIDRNMHVGKDGFEVKLDVQHFKPEEINVKTIDNSIIIEAKHEEKKDSELSYISRQFVRRFDLPKGFKSEHVVTTLSTDGVLSIKCPKSEALEGVKVREIQIKPTGPVRTTDKKAEDKQQDAISENSEENLAEETETDK